MNNQHRSRSIIGCGIFALVLCFPPAATAIPVSEYQKNLQKVITALDTLAQVDEEETRANYEQRLTQTTELVRNALPEHQSVESDDSVCSVDNSWLHKKLDELEAANDVDRSTIRVQLIETLKAIDERATELVKATEVSRLSKADANQKLTEILGRPEYATQSKQSGALFRLLDRFIRWIAKYLPQRSPLSPSKTSPLTTLAQIGVVGLAIAVIFYVLLKLFRHLTGHRGPKKIKDKKEPRIVLGERLEPETSATDLLAEAEALARRGEIRAAIRKAYIALLVELGDRKVISLAQHKTNRDYLRSVSGFPVIHQNMIGLTDSFERHWYGFAESSPLDWQDFKSGYLAALRSND